MKRVKAKAKRFWMPYATGMQHFDAEIEKLIRAGIVDFESDMSYATNAGNLRLEMADFLEERRSGAPSGSSGETTEMEIER